MEITLSDNYDCLKSFVYFSEEYQQLFAEYDGACQKTLLCMDFGVMGKVVIPLLLTKIDEYYESYSAYGYTGPMYFGDLTLNEVNALISTECVHIQAFMQEQKIINVFIRFSPFLANVKLLSNNNIALNRITYATTLKQYNDISEYLKSVPQKLRWSINYAIKNGFKHKIYNSDNLCDGTLKEFYNLYKNLMLGKNTSDYYLFNYEFFEKHFTRLKKKCDLIIISDANNKLVGGAIFLKDDTGFVHYHLSASDKDYAKYQIMEFLLATAIVHYGNIGYQKMHLGGGLKFDCSDGLSKFKKKFSDTQLEYYVGKFLFDDVVYKNIREKNNFDSNGLFLISDCLNSIT